MKKNLLKSMVAVAMLCFGAMNVFAQEEEEDANLIPVKMTYVNYDAADDIVGEVDTIKVGYNKAPSVDGTIAFGNTGWGVNLIGYLQVDATAVPGIVTKATLCAKISGSADSKRGTSWGLALTDNAWSDQLSYNITKDWTVTKLLNNGELVYSSQKSATTFEEVEFDVTEALQGADFTGFATIIVYETAAAGGYMTEAYVEVEYEPYEATSMTYDFEGEEAVNPFTDDSRIASAIEADEALGSNVLGWTCANNAQNGYSFSHYDFTSLLNNPALVRVEFDYFNTKGGRAILNIGDALVRGTTGGSSKVTYNKTGVIFQIGSDKNNAFINGINIGQDDKEVSIPIIDEETGEETGSINYTELGLCDKWLHVVVIINNDAKTVTWGVTNQEQELVHTGTSAFFADDANAATQIDLFGYINNSHCAMIDNLTITNYKSNAVFADYTIQYVDADGNEIKPARTGNGQVGKFVKLLDSDKTSVYNEDNTKKYIYDSDDSETVAIAEEGTVITVKFRDAEVWNAVLNCMIEGTSGAANRLAQFQGTFFEGDNYYVYPARGYEKNGKYYFTPATSWNGATFTFPGSIAPATNAGKKYYIGTLYYTLEENVAYYSDFERLALPVEDESNGTGLGQLYGTVNNWWSFSNGIFDRFSQGRGIRLDNDSYVWTEPIAEDGTYMVRIYGRNDQSANCVAPYALGMRDAEGNVEIFSVDVPDWGSATTGESIIGNAAVEAQEATEESEAVEAKDASGIGLKAGWSLVVLNTGNGSMISLDDIKLTKVGDYTETTTGIKEVVTLQNSGLIYNLNGQVVKNAQKGLYIINGKKVVRK